MPAKSSTIILGILLTFMLTGKAQTISRSTLGMAGSSQTIQSKGHSYFVSQSIGQASVIGTFTRNGKVIRQGFQQPPQGLMVGKVKKDQLNAVIYPNPTDQILNIKLAERSITEWNIELTDYAGRLLYQARYDEVQPVSIDLSAFSSGVYLLKIASNDGFLYTPVIKY